MKHGLRKAPLLIALILVGALGHTSSASAEPGKAWTSWFGADFGASAIGDGGAITGDAPKFLDEMGATIEDGSHGITSIAAGFSQGYRFLPWLALEVNQRFYWAGMSAEFPMNPDMDYSIRRFFMPISVMARFSPVTQTGSTYASFGLGPTAALIYTVESGYLGREKAWDLRPGASGSAAY